METRVAVRTGDILSTDLGMVRKFFAEMEAVVPSVDIAKTTSEPERFLLMPFNRRVWAYTGTRFHSGKTPVDFLRRIKLFIQAQLHRKTLKLWHDRQSGPHAAEILWRHPLLPIVVDRPYMNVAWEFPQKQSVIEKHYSFLDGPRAVLDFALDGSRTLIGLDELFPGLRIVLDKPTWFFDEGEVCLNLFIGDQRVYSLAFTLGQCNGKRIAYLGALQAGGHGGAALERNRVLTRSAHGLRPRDLLFTNFRILCGLMEIERLFAPRHCHSILHSSYFKVRRNAGHLDYDAIWTEFGGTLCPDTGMYVISPGYPVREAAAIPARKRGLYRRRYEMLDQLKSRMAGALADEGYLASGR